MHSSPGGVVTYAEAGGWGRALILESRRRKHSLGRAPARLHLPALAELPARARRDGEPDDRRVPASVADAAVRRLRGAAPARARPLSARDARRHRQRAPGRDGHARWRRSRQTPGELLREALAIGAEEEIVVVTTKEKEARGSLGGLIDAAAAPARRHDRDQASPRGNRRRLRGIPPGAPARDGRGRRGVALAAAGSRARAVVTVNSTVALDAAVMGVPALVLGLPNNLSPFVDAGAMAGSRGSR